MEIEKLMHTGLSEKESRIYASLLEMQEAGVTELSKRTKINRTLLYEILRQLENKGIVSYIIKNNVRYYRACAPNKILEILKEKEVSFSSILPELIALQGKVAKKPIIEILEGTEGIKTILYDMLRLKEEWYAFDIPGKGPEILGPTAESFEKERQKEKITLKVICVKTKDGLKRGKQFSKMKYTYVRYAPQAYESPASNWIYGDRIAILFWYKEFPFAVRIIDKNLAESYKNHFEWLWKTAKK